MTKTVQESIEDFYKSFWECGNSLQEDLDAELWALTLEFHLLFYCLKNLY